MEFGSGVMEIAPLNKGENADLQVIDIQSAMNVAIVKGKELANKVNRNLVIMTNLAIITMKILDGRSILYKPKSNYTFLGVSDFESRKSLFVGTYSRILVMSSLKSLEINAKIFFSFKYNSGYFKR
ncbi:hypothetical protein TorRG33x02_140270 [Trema orientale]|uniref:Uncharacterized protein n=1 Tax=Trema orientale TaxID=63057 RepID=A0A2P5EXB0_TREOI|nr:hypothetical protein TorRG33x02_140270 [Trema orientale]